MLCMELLQTPLQLMQLHNLFLLPLSLMLLVRIVLHIQHFHLQRLLPLSQILYYHLILNLFLGLVHFVLKHIQMSCMALHLFFLVLLFFLLSPAMRNYLFYFCLPRMNHLSLLIEQILLRNLLFLRYIHKLKPLDHRNLCHTVLPILLSLHCLHLDLLLILFLSLLPRRIR